MKSHLITAICAAVICAADAPAAPAAGASATAYDTGSPVDLGETAASLGEGSWKALGKDAAGQAVGGDAVLMNNLLAVVIRRDGSGVDLYARGTGGWTKSARLVPAAGGAPQKLSGLKAAAGDAGVGIEASAGAGTLVFAMDKPGLPAVKVTPKGNVEALRFIAPCRLSIVPDFYADDIMIDARRIPVEKVLMPADHLFLHLVGGGDTIVAAVWEKAERDLEIGIGGDGEQRRIASTDVFLGGGSAYAAVLVENNIWYSKEFTSDEIKKGGSFDWKIPFSAKWKGNFTKSDGSIYSRQFLTRGAQGNSAGWTDSLTQKGGSFIPSLQAARKGSSRFNEASFEAADGVMAGYPMSRDEDTPIDKLCIDDLLRLLGTEVCAYVLDLDGRKARDNGIFTCAYNVFLPRIMPNAYPRNDRAVAAFIKDERVYIRHYSDQVVVFIKHIQDRINDFIAFRKDTLVYLDEQEKQHPELADFIGRLREQLTRKVPVFSKFEDAMKEADGVARAMPLLNEREKAILMDVPDQAAAAVGIGGGIKHIGDPQDSRIRNDRMITMAIRAMASMEMAVNPAAAEIAKEIRERTQKVLRGGAVHEKTIQW